MGKLVLVLGGARSGKSTYAERRAEQSGGAVLYVATSEPGDAEMADRIAHHQAGRPADWATVESARGVAEAIRAAGSDAPAVIVDCLTLLAANWLVAETGEYADPFDAPEHDPFDPAIEAALVREVEALADLAAERDGEMIVVSNEVGLGVVPPYELGRAYRDVLGRANQVMAARADEVLLLVAGIPMTVKGPA